FSFFPNNDMNPISLFLQLAFHQVCESFLRAQSFIEDGIHLLGDRHLNSKLRCKIDGRLRRSYAFSDGAHACRNLLDTSAAAEFDPHAPIAAKAAVRCQHEIAKTCKSGHCFATS